MNNLLIANCISAVSAMFTCLSCYSKDRARIYYYQVGQCVALAIANIFFNSYAGIITLVICALRNFLLGKNIYNKYICVSLAAGMLIFGAILNNNGAVGWIVIAANFIYTLGAYFAKNELTIKLNMILDLVLWMIYEVFIIDVPSFIADSIAVVIAIIAIIRYLRNRAKSASEVSSEITPNATSEATTNIQNEK